MSLKTIFQNRKGEAASLIIVVSMIVVTLGIITGSRVLEERLGTASRATSASLPDVFIESLQIEFNAANQPVLTTVIKNKGSVAVSYNTPADMKLEIKEGSIVHCSAQMHITIFGLAAQAKKTFQTSFASQVYSSCPTFIPTGGKTYTIHATVDVTNSIKESNENNNKAQLNFVAPVVSSTPTPSLSTTVTVTPSITASPSATLTPSATPSATLTATPSITATPSATLTPSATPSATLTPGEEEEATPSGTITPIGSQTPSPGVTPVAPCPKKYLGDANCKSTPSGKAIDVLDYAIWYSEFINGCSSTNLAGCGLDLDGDGSPMDANFNYPGTNYIVNDEIVSIFDYSIWIQGLDTEQ